MPEKSRRNYADFLLGIIVNKTGVAQTYVGKGDVV
jgi:hypothetical protein